MIKFVQVQVGDESKFLGRKFVELTDHSHEECLRLVVQDVEWLRVKRAISISEHERESQGVTVRKGGNRSGPGIQYVRLFLPYNLRPSAGTMREDSPGSQRPWNDRNIGTEIRYRQP